MAHARTVSHMTSIQIQPKLSICIPTYDRANLLGQALQAISHQWELDLSEQQQLQIELIISDNHSPDETPQVIARLSSSFPSLPLISFRQPENIGAAANVLHVAAMATGEYIYLLSDDDLLLPGALAGMLTLIGEYPQMPAFCLNTRSFVHDPALGVTKPDFKVFSDQAIKDRSECLQFIGSRITFISLLLFRRDHLSPSGYSHRTTSRIPHSYPFLDVLSRDGRMVATKQVFLAVRGNNTGGYSFYEVFVSHFADVMRYARSQGYSEKAVQAVLSQHLIRFLAPFTAYFKLHGTFGQLQPDFSDGVKRLLAEYGFHPLFIFGLLPMMLAPPKLAKGIHRIFRWIRGQKEKRDAL